MRTVPLAVLLMVVTSAVEGQQRATELGLGITAAGVSISGGETVFQFQANQQFVSVGLYMSPGVAIEPAATISVTSGGGGTLASFGLGVSVPIYTRKDWGRTGLFFAPRGGIRIISASGGGFSETASQFSVGMGVGTKIRVSDPVSLSVSGNFGYAPETDTFNDAVTIDARLGLSVFFQ